MSKAKFDCHARLPVDLGEWLLATAKEEGRTMNGQVTYLLRLAMKAAKVREDANDVRR